MGGVHLFKMTGWKSASGKWYCNDVTNLGGRSAKWYTPMRILNLSIEEYIDLLINQFHACGLQYFERTDYLHFYFNTEAEVKAFCSFVNKQAKKINYNCA